VERAYFGKLTARYFILRTYGVGQFYNHRGYRNYAKIWARITRHILLRFREDEKKDLRGLLSSVLVQLCHQSDSYYDILSKFYSEHEDGSKAPSDDALVRCLERLLELPGQAPIFLIVDALDECENMSTIVPSRGCLNAFGGTYRLTTLADPRSISNLSSSH
jgi:hypothetical protein